MNICVNMTGSMWSSFAHGCAASAVLAVGRACQDDTNSESGSIVSLLDAERGGQAKSVSDGVCRKVRSLGVRHCAWHMGQRTRFSSAPAVTRS